MQAYGDKDRARAAEAGDHRWAIGTPADDIGGPVGNELCDPERYPAAVLPDAADVAGDTRLPSHGRHYNEGIHLEPSENYQGEFELHFDDAGNGSMRVNLDIGDLAALRAALPGRQGVSAAEVREFLRGLHGSCEKNPGSGGDAHEAHKNLAAIVRVIAMLGEA